MHIIPRFRNLMMILNIMGLSIIFIYAAKEIAIPAIAAVIYEAEYKELVFKCDNVMRDHFIAKSQVLAAPSSQSIKNLHAAEIGLMTCHDYDVLRKKLISFGLSENDLSKIGLEVIEEKAKDVRSFVQTHEIRY